MSAETQIGRVIIFGLDGTMLYSGMATTGNEPSAISYDDTVEVHRSKDRKGEVIGAQFYNAVKKIIVNFYPCVAAGGTKAAAQANMVLPPYGAKATLAGFPPVPATVEDTINSAKWIYFGGGKIDLSNEAEVKMVLPLERYNTDISTPNT
jgi:hypothetical protein